MKPASRISAVVRSSRASAVADVMLPAFPAFLLAVVGKRAFAIRRIIGFPQSIMSAQPSASCIPHRRGLTARHANRRVMP